MQKKPYSLKWAITYNNKRYIIVYGKKRAYDLAYKLSYCTIGLNVEPVEPTRKEFNAARQKINEYYRKWRKENHDKVKEYQKRYRSRKQEI